MQGESRLGEFAVESKLGEGSFSCVYKVRRIDDGKFYAMKKVKIGQMKEKQRENALNEVRILASISHPNIVNYRDAFFDDRTQTLCIVMELADAGDVQKKINDHLKNNTHFNEAEIWQGLLQMTRGLKVLHEINILHRDLKCANVFCTSDRCYKLGDLNVSKVAKRGMARTQTGTPYYTSPEVWNDKAYDAKCDIWSLGCVIYQMASLRPPFRASNLKELYAKIQKGIYQPLPRFYSQDLRTIVGMCLRVNPTQRMSASEILQHPFITKNTPANELANQSNNQTSKCSLLKTIIVPKNLRGLKQALPASKYEQPLKVVQPDAKMRRANSANNIREIPQVIPSPKMEGGNNQILRYAFNRRPSQEKRQFHSERPQEIVRGMPRMQRNNSVDYMRKRVESNQSIDSNRNRQNSRDNIRLNDKQTPKIIPRPISRHRDEKIIPRPLSRQALRPSSREVRQSINSNLSKEIRSNSRQIRVNSRQAAGEIRYGSRERGNSRDLSRDGKQGMEEISNRCKQIEQRVRIIMEKKKEQKQQRNPNLPVIKPKEMNYIYQRPVSRERDLSRNKSIQIARQELRQNDSKKVLERPSSRERLDSLERNKKIGQRYNY